MYYEVHGDGPPVLLLHGGLGTIETTFSKMLPELARDQRVIAVGSGSACPRLLTVKEVAGRLRLSTATVYALCERGERAFVRVLTHSIRIDDRDVADLVRRRGVRRG